jgi:hypothetical protein
VILISFPATYNIRYYQGDLYQFVIRPKTSAGNIFEVNSATYDAKFRISTQRSPTTATTLSTVKEDAAIVKSAPTPLLVGPLVLN